MRIFEKLFKQTREQLTPEYVWEPWEVKAQRFDKAKKEFEKGLNLSGYDTRFTLGE
ncbi:hypothetical protein [Streptococcus jiangjianxini]|uniref:hypothetical protein n=1 Tax=Streptococcus jiangjianxini TaxID=3161189 RepID=UPI0032ED7982